MQTTRTCTICHLTKELTNFHVRRSDKLGRQKACKVCQIAAVRRTVDPARVKRYSDYYYKVHPKAPKVVRERRAERQAERRKAARLAKPPRVSKVCPKCKAEKPLDGFYVRTGTTRPQSWCKLCMSSYSRVQNRLHPEWNARSTAKWAKMHPEKVAITNHKWYAKHRETILAKRRQRYADAHGK